MGAGGCHAIGTPIFFQFCGTLRRCQGNILFKFCKSTEDSAIKGVGECNTLFLTPLALNIHDTYIVNNHGVELKAKAPPSIGYAMFWVEIVTDGISGHAAYI